MGSTLSGDLPQRVPKPKWLLPTLFALLTLMVLITGYQGKEDTGLSAEEGAGYWLGIMGGSAMLLLLSYPLAKRSRWLNQRIAVRHWFRLHMMLGILGPLAILYHCNFQMGSLNSSVALICMLLVVASGVVGRYFYSKVHLGLYGQKANSQALLRTAQEQRSQLLHRFAAYPDLAEKIEHIYHRLLPQQPMAGSSLGAILAAPRRWYSRWLFFSALNRHTEPELRTLMKDARATLDSYLDTLRKLAQLQLFERLLSWWHVLHMPIFIMMLITAVIHVWAVHVY